MREYYPKLLMMARRSRKSEVFKGGFLLAGILILILGMYLASDHAQQVYARDHLPCSLNNVNDLENCKEFLLPMQ